jgi:hypothetical protein
MLIGETRSKCFQTFAVHSVTKQTYISLFLSILFKAVYSVPVCTYTSPENADCASHDINNGGEVMTLDKCKEACTKRGDCKSFVHTTRNSNCFLKDYVCPRKELDENKMDLVFYISKFVQTLTLRPWSYGD